jgi:hypothetical protein
MSARLGSSGLGTSGLGSGIETLKKAAADKAAGVEEPAASGEDYEAPTGDGRNSRHQLFAVLLADDLKLQWLIPYGAVVLGRGPVNQSPFVFVFSAGRDELYEVTVEGPQIQYAVEKFAEGKRVSWHANGEGTTSIRVRALPQKEK